MTQNLVYSICLILSIALCLICPEEYSELYVDMCFAMSLFVSSKYVMSQRKINYFDFDMIFLIILFVCFYAYPVLLYNLPNGYDENFDSIINVKNICRGAGLSNSAICAYVLGASGMEHRENNYEEGFTESEFTPINVKFLSILFFLFTFYTLTHGSIEAYQAEYRDDVVDKGSRLVRQLTALNKALFFVILATEAYNYYYTKYIKINGWFLSAVLINSALMLYAGNRTIPSIYILPIVFFY